ncbi:DUF1758 domain-containing protein [Trichonephila clavipes]|nr:DUF1758 domain-containing protein [Trichonephila clavipes]
MREDACVRTCQPDYIWSEKLKDFSIADVGSITRIATFMDNVSEHVDITELEVKLKKIDQLQRKIEELKELLFGLETANPTEEAEFEEDLYKCETRLDDLEVSRIEPRKRLDLVRLHKLCELCLRKTTKGCNVLRRMCAHVAKKHSRSLCTAAIDDRKKWVIPSAELPVLTNPEDRESNVVDSSTQNTVLSSTASQHRKNVLISTGSVFLRNNEGRELKCPVIFDSASNINIISRKMCDFLDNDSVDDTLKLFFELESLGIKDDPCYRKDDQAMNIFKETVQYNNNRYVVELPFRKHWNELSNNISVAKQRFQSLWGRLRRDKTLYTQYKETIQDYLNQGIIEKVNDTEINVHKPMYYLPHKAIKKEGRVTTSTRIVFDAASHQANELSLNDCLWPGPNLNPNFLDVLINFRLNRVAISSDIRQAFLQICLADKHKDFVRFLWTDSNPRIGEKAHFASL